VFRNVALGLVLAWMAAGCSLGGASGAGSTHDAKSSPVSPVTSPSRLIIKEWFDPPQVEVKAAPGDKVLEVQTRKHLTGPQRIAASWQAGLDALATTQARVVGVGVGDSATEPVGAISYALHRSSSFVPDQLSQVQPTVRKAAARLGLRIVHLSVRESAAGPAVLIIATTIRGSATQFARHHLGLSALLGLHGSAIFAQLVDSHGNAILADAGIARSEVEFSWADPSVHAHFGFGFGQRAAPPAT
jgi:hypothetical protein